MPNLSVTVKGIEKLQKFPNWQNVLNDWLVIALKLSLGNMKSVAKRNAYERFQNPSGELEKHFLEPIYSYSYPNFAGAVTNDAPHAMRREYGFSGKTDSLGRYYPNDPGVLYMTDTLISEKEWTRAKFQWAINRALAELSSGGA